MKLDKCNQLDKIKLLVDDNFLWVDKNNKKLRISDLHSVHLLNILLMLWYYIDIKRFRKWIKRNGRGRDNMKLKYRFQAFVNVYYELNNRKDLKYPRLKILNGLIYSFKKLNEK